MKWLGEHLLPLVLAPLLGCSPNTSARPLRPVDASLEPCGHALVVISSDSQYQSTTVGLVGFDGTVLAPSLVSSDSATVGLSAAFSGDVVGTTSAATNGFVLIDRTPAGVLSWVDPKAGGVVRQLSVRAGTNPQDYIDIDPHKAYVSRYEANPEAGTDSFDQGSDVLIVDPSVPSITGRIPLTEAFADAPGQLLPHPNRMIRVGDQIVVLVALYSKSFLQSGDSALVRIDPATDTIVGIVKLAGLDACLGLALSPNGKKLAASCPGAFNGKATPGLGRAGVAIVDTKSFAVTDVLAASDLDYQPPAFSIAFASEERLLLPTAGSLDAGTLDHLLEVDLTTRSVETVETSLHAFDFGEVHCAPACGACYLADADGARIRRYSLDSSGNTLGSSDIRLGDGIGAIPRYFATY